MTGLLSHTLFNPGGMRGMDFPNPTPTLQHPISNTPGLPKPLLFTSVMGNTAVAGSTPASSMSAWV